MIVCLYIDCTYKEQVFLMGDTFPPEEGSCDIW